MTSNVSGASSSAFCLCKQGFYSKTGYAPLQDPAGSCVACDDRATCFGFLPLRQALLAAPVARENAFGVYLDVNGHPEFFFADCSLLQRCEAVCPGGSLDECHTEVPVLPITPTMNLSDLGESVALSKCKKHARGFLCEVIHSSIHSPTH